jgi:hypothetical protein
MTKEELINTLLHNPLAFDRRLMDDLVSKELCFKDLRECIRRIYDLSESQLEETSNANKGIMGWLNRKSTLKRIKRFANKIKRLKQDKSYRIIYAEGDSWFQFPLFIKDIIDWLNDNRQYVIYSDAYGGDWITNIIYESQYVSALSVLRPGYFLISGGGNDMVGNNRLSIMVQKNYGKPKYTDIAQIADDNLSERQKERIIEAQPHITKEFYAFLLTIKAQYILLFNSIYHPDSPHKDIISITQGYDYAIPSYSRQFSFRYPLKFIVNRFVDSGCWLIRPLKIKGIFEENLQKSIVLTFIYEFNKIFIELATQYGFDNVYHVDCRGLASSIDDWYDELHYKRHVYKIAARGYSHIIENHGNCEKIVRAADFRKKQLTVGNEKQSFIEARNPTMYYLVIRTMNFEKCIDKNSHDIYKTPGNYNCIRSLSYNKTNLVRKIRIKCIENPSEEIDATVYCD